MPNPESLYQIDRTVDTSTSGIDIIRKFYCDPYDAHPEVLKYLRGFVTKGPGDADEWKRRAPDRDPWIDNCYCTDARVVFPDPRVFASATEPPDNGTVTNIPAWLAKKETFPPGVAGCHIEAHYRPLITAWIGTDGKPADDAGKDSKADWLDPTFVPGVVQLPWPDGLFVRAPEAVPFGGAVAGAGILGGLFAIANSIQTIGVPDSAGIPMEVPVNDFSIRRILVGEPPWEVIEACNNAVNAEDWPRAGTAAARGLPTFRARTLKFVGADTPNRVDATGRRYYDMTLRFKWISEFTDKLYDQDANFDKGWVTWNHVFMRPGRLGINRPTAWYEVFRAEQRLIANVAVPIDIPGFAVSAGRLHNSVDFDKLFHLNP